MDINQKIVLFMKIITVANTATIILLLCKIFNLI